MKKITFFVLVLIFALNSFNAYADYEQNELLIYNNSGDDLLIKLYPVSGLFNCSPSNQTISTQYSNFSYSYDPEDPLSGGARRGGGPRVKTILGLDGYALNNDGYFELSDGQSCQFSHDFSIFPAAVGVPKSLRKSFREFLMLCANFLVTNSKGSGRGIIFI